MGFDSDFDGGCGRSFAVQVCEFLQFCKPPINSASRAVHLVRVLHLCLDRCWRCTCRRARQMATRCETDCSGVCGRQNGLERSADSRGLDAGHLQGNGRRAPGCGRWRCDLRAEAAGRAGRAGPGLRTPQGPDPASQEHADFKRKGADLYVERKISLVEASRREGGF